MRTTRNRRPNLCRKDYDIVRRSSPIRIAERLAEISDTDITMRHLDLAKHFAEYPHRIYPHRIATPKEYRYDSTQIR